MQLVDTTNHKKRQEMNAEHKLIKIDNKWNYRGVVLHKDGTKGFIYRWITRTDKYSQSSCVVPNALKNLIPAIDKAIADGFIVEMGRLIKCTRTNCEAI